MSYHALGGSFEGRVDVRCDLSGCYDASGAKVSAATTGSDGKPQPVVPPGPQCPGGQQVYFAATRDPTGLLGDWYATCAASCPPGTIGVDVGICKPSVLFPTGSPGAAMFQATHQTVQWGSPGGTCLTPNDALAIAACIVDPSLSGCGPMLGRRSQSLCPGAPPPPVPACRDATWNLGLDYCQTNHWAGYGPDPTGNALCYLAGKYPTWLEAVAATPDCGDWSGEGGTGGGDDGGNMLLWVGLGVAALGGLYLATRKR